MKVEVFVGGYDRNFSYLIYDEETKEALVIDPQENIDIYYDKAKELDLLIVGVLNTHDHFDHVEGNAKFASRSVSFERHNVGKSQVKIIPTPGHTTDSVCLYVDGMLFTGDTLFVGKVGGTSGVEDSKQQYESLQKLMELPDDTIVYSGHDYGEKPVSDIGFEKKNNPFLVCKSFEKFFYLKQHWLEYKSEHGIE